MMFKNITLGAAAALTAITAFPAAAEARGHHNNGYYQSRYDRGYDNRYARSYDDRYYRGRSDYRGYKRCSGTTGTIIGGAGGALAGRAIDRDCRR